MGDKKQNGAGQQRNSLMHSIASQQRTIDDQETRLQRAASVTDRQGKLIQRLAAQNETLARGLRALASGLGPEAERYVVAAMTRTADVNNPAQPIPEPPAQPAPFSTVDAKTPEAMESPQNPGLVPGSTNDVAADATTTVYSSGEDVGTSALHNLIDVTTPVDGTQGPRPLSETRTLTDVRVGDPNNQSQAFPLRGDFAQRQSLQGQGSRQPEPAQTGSRRTMAALRLVEARAATGDDEANGNKYALAAAIEKSATATEDIEREIETLEKVGHRMASRTAGKPAPRGLVPRQASAQPRAVPQMSSEASYSGTPVDTSLVDDADLFM